MTTKPPSSPQGPASPNLAPEHDVLLDQLRAMYSFALGQGKHPIPKAVTEALEKAHDKGKESLGHKQLIELAAAHASLAKIVAPARPHAIHYLDQNGVNKADRTSSFNPRIRIPLIRQMLVVALLSIGAFVWLAQSVELELVEELISGTFGPESLRAMGLLLVAALLGASFHALFKADRYVVRGTFDPKYISSYWIRLVLGVMAGFILAVVVPGDFTDPGATFTRPLLALLGGFSAQAVHEVLKRLVETVTAMVQGTSDDLIEARGEALQASFEQRAILGHVRRQRKLLDTLRSIRESGDTKEASEIVENLIEKLDTDPEMESAT